MAIKTTTREIRMKLLSLTLAMLIGSSAFAAQFQSARMQSAAAQKLAQVATTIARDKENFGDMGTIKSVVFTRKAGEQDRNTVAQLNHQLGGLNSDDQSAVDMNRQSAKALANHLLSFNSQYDDENAYVRALNSLEDAIQAVKADKNLRIYGTNHADEDGSWQILTILDFKNHQILFIRLGYSGT